MLQSRISVSGIKKGSDRLNEPEGWTVIRYLSQKACRKYWVALVFLQNNSTLVAAYSKTFSIFVKSCKRLTYIIESVSLIPCIRNLINLIYNYLTIYKWVVYEFYFWNKKQIRNKNGFLGKSSFFCLHYFSFLSLACNQSTNPSYYYAFSSWFNICFFIYPGIRSEKRKVLFSMIGINMCKVKNNHPSNQIFVYF